MFKTRLIKWNRTGCTGIITDHYRRKRSIGSTVRNFPDRNV